MCYRSSLVADTILSKELLYYTVTRKKPMYQEQPYNHRPTVYLYSEPLTCWASFPPVSHVPISQQKSGKSLDIEPTYTLLRLCEDPTHGFPKMNSGTKVLSECTAIFSRIASGKSKSKKTHPATLSNTTSDNRTKEKDTLLTLLKIFILAQDHTTQETATLLRKNGFSEKAINANQLTAFWLSSSL